jgi:hypothetical protein
MSRNQTERKNELLRLKLQPAPLKGFKRDVSGMDRYSKFEKRISSRKPMYEEKRLSRV